MEPHHLHVPQAYMLVVDSKPLTKPHSSSEQPDKKNINKVGQNHKMALASDTLWTHIGTTLVTYMHIWLGGV